MADILSERTDSLWWGLFDTPLSLDEAFRFLQSERAGAVNCFVGTTRRWTADRETVYLAYEAYAPMAMEAMRQLLEEAAGRWPLLRACLLHRTGEVPPAEPSVIVGVATPHRAEAFEATRWLMDRLKERVPIWKREHYASGEKTWVLGTLPPTEDPSDG